MTYLLGSIPTQGEVTCQWNALLVPDDTQPHITTDFTISFHHYLPEVERKSNHVQEKVPVTLQPWGKLLHCRSVHSCRTNSMFQMCLKVPLLRKEIEGLTTFFISLRTLHVVKL